MAYHLSAAKLQTYQTCPKSYYFKYERGLPGGGFGKSQALGTALHKALAQIYQDWDYLQPMPSFEWLEYCWQNHSQDLDPGQFREGLTILKNYYDRFMTELPSLRRPLAVEGKIQAPWFLDNIEFTLSGRYDRLDWLGDDLELIDYKSTKEIKSLDSNRIDLQLGLYAIALQHIYNCRLKKLSLIYLRTGDKIEFEVTPEHDRRVRQTIAKMAKQLRGEREWKPHQTKACDRCQYSRYCPAIHAEPDPLPESAKPERELQLTLDL
jgi:putative RecB family exonuclease